MEEKSKKFSIKKLLLLFFAVVVSGAVCGVIGAFFSISVSFVTEVREKYTLILLFLPLAGLLSVFLYKLFKVKGKDNITDDAVLSSHSATPVSPLLAPAVFICSVITHLFGGSAGREGAALKIGSGIATAFTKLLRLGERGRRTLLLCGMSGVFSAVFGTPVGAAVFSLEVVRTKTAHPLAIVFSFVSSFSAYFIAKFIGAKPERFHIPNLPALSFDVVWRVIVVALAGGLVAYLYCKAIRLTKKGAGKLFKNEYVRIAVLGAVIVAISFVEGSFDYNGGGVAVIESIFEGETVVFYAFIMKIVLTALTAAAGFKGGEIVPGFFVGATFGATLSSFIGLSPAFGAAIGMVALFCGITNCPVTTMILAAELFGVKGIGFFALAVVFSFISSGEVCLYNRKKNFFKALKEDDKI